MTAPATAKKAGDKKPKPTEAEVVKTRKAFAKILQDMPENWIACRDFRHSWDVLNDFHVTPVEGTKVTHFARNLECARCGTYRDELHVMLKGVGMDKVAQDYRHPEGYIITGLGPVDQRSKVIQMEQYRRAIAKAANAEPGQKDAPEK